MPRSGPSHAVNDAWRARVERALKERQWQRIDLVKAVGCSPSVITALLNGNKNESPYAPEIHAVLGWPPPNPPLLPEDEEEMLCIYRQLEKCARERLKGIGLGMAALIKQPKNP